MSGFAGLPALTCILCFKEGADEEAVICDSCASTANHLAVKADMLEDEVAALRARLAEAERLLRDPGLSYCFVCLADKPLHREDCALAAFLEPRC